MQEKSIFEEFAKVSEDKDPLSEILTLVEEQLSLELKIQEIEEELALTKKELQKVSQEKLPFLLREKGINEITLDSRFRITVSDEIKPSISRENMSAAYDSMVLISGKDNVDPLFKRSVQVNLSEISVDEEQVLIQHLLKERYPYSFENSIHHQTLKQYCKGIRAEGKQMPEGISVYEYSVSKIKQVS